MRKNRGYTITARFTILTAALLIASMTTLSVVTYGSFSRMVDHKVEQLSENLLSLVGKNLDYIIADVQDTSNLLLTSRAVQRTLVYAGKQDKLLEYNQSLMDTNDIMNNMVNNKTYLSAVYIGNKDVAITSRKGVHFNLKIKEVDYDNPPKWLEAIYARDGKSIWFHGEQVVDFEGNLLVYGRLIRNLNNLQRIGIMLIALDADTLDDIFGEIENTNHMSILLWEDTQLIYAFDKAGNVSLSAIRYEDVGTFNGFTNLNGMRYYIRNLDNSLSGWRVSCMIPYHDFQAEKQFIMILVVSISVLLLLIAMLAGYQITRRSITGTLRQLHSFVESFRATGNCDSFVFDRRDEVGLIGEEFVRVIRENERLMINLYKSRYREKEAELIALQSQINPHFLYNALDSMFWTAQEYGAENIAQMAVALSNVFRMSLNSGREFWKLADELELVRNYLTVQNMRFEGRFEVNINLPEELMNLEIIKLILQPVVENAIVHGLEKRIGRGKIEITAEESGADLTFVISDNGAGFTVDEKNPLGKGYALNNVNERIKLYYGANYGVFIQSQPNVGTTVRISICRDKPHGN